MSLIRTISLTAFAALLVVGCGKKDGADKYLDQLDKAVTDGMALIKDKKPKTFQELEALPEWKAIDDAGRVASDSLKAYNDKLTPEQQKRRDDINKRVQEMQTMMSSMTAPSTPPPSTPSTPPAGDTAATAAPSTTPADTAAAAAPSTKPADAAAAPAADTAKK